MNKLVKELKKQEWVVTEDGGRLLEAIISQMTQMSKLLKKLKKQIKRLDEKETLQTEIEFALRERVSEQDAELEILRSRDSGEVLVPGVPYTLEPATPVCTPNRGLTWTNYGIDGSRWFSSASVDPHTVLVSETTITGELYEG